MDYITLLQEYTIGDNDKLKIYDEVFQIYAKAQEEDYLKKVMIIAKKAEELQENGSFKRANIEFIRIMMNKLSRHWITSLSFMNKEGNTVQLKDEDNELKEFGRILYDTFLGENYKSINNKFRSKDGLDIKIEKGFEEKFLNTFMPKELRIMFDHNVLQANLQVNEIEIKNKMKI